MYTKSKIESQIICRSNLVLIFILNVVSPSGRLAVWQSPVSGLECDFAGKQSRSQYWYTGGGQNPREWKLRPKLKR
jgi:hypothetical protein